MSIKQTNGREQITVEYGILLLEWEYIVVSRAWKRDEESWGNVRACVCVWNVLMAGS